MAESHAAARQCKDDFVSVGKNSQWTHRIHATLNTFDYIGKDEFCVEFETALLGAVVHQIGQMYTAFSEVQLVSRESGQQRLIFAIFVPNDAS